MSAREKIAYLRGLIEGQNLAENAGMSKFHEALLGTLDSIVDELDDIAADQDDLREYVEDLEDEVLSSDGDASGDLSELSGCHECAAEGEDEEEYEPVTCPACEKDFFYQPDAYDDDEELICPHCGEPFKQ
ncbi:MAG: hypothetical protein LBQ36_06060 [Synergistaceae bacterium]|nr:hypothetical protein [Synergistaceae bacterium]